MSAKALKNFDKGNPLFNSNKTHIFLQVSKGGFFSESAIRFPNLQISKKKYSKKNYPELEI